MVFLRCFASGIKRVDARRVQIVPISMRTTKSFSPVYLHGLAMESLVRSRRAFKGMVNGSAVCFFHCISGFGPRACSFFAAYRVPRLLSCAYELVSFRCYLLAGSN